MRRTIKICGEIEESSTFCDLLLVALAQAAVSQPHRT
jgi:hypothetical protein